MTRIVFGLALALATSGADGQQAPVFRSTGVSVSVYTSVKQGNNAIANLTAADFRLTDNGVPQVVEAASLESVPIDATLFLDTSGSTAGKLDEMKRDVQGMVKLLRTGDRFRLLTIGDSVYETVPWVPAGATLDLSFGPVGGISLVQDALAIALLHRPDPGRRHLIVGMTDRRDCGSVVPSGLLRELAARSESVLHLVQQEGSGGRSNYRVRTCSPTARPDGADLIQEAAERTGGELHTGSFLFRSSSLLRSFKRVFDDFRQSYTLRYSPTGIAAPGWHAIDVRVPNKPTATISARKGYYGS